MLQRVRVLVPGKQHVGVLQQLLPETMKDSYVNVSFIFIFMLRLNIPDHVSYGVIFLVDGENCSIWNLGVLLPRDLLLSLKQQE